MNWPQYMSFLKFRVRHDRFRADPFSIFWLSGDSVENHFDHSFGRPSRARSISVIPSIPGLIVRSLNPAASSNLRNPNMV